MALGRLSAGARHTQPASTCERNISRSFRKSLTALRTRRAGFRCARSTERRPEGRTALQVAGGYGLMVIFMVEVVFFTSWALPLSFRPLNVTSPTAGPWPASGISLAHSPKPDLAS